MQKRINVLQEGSEKIDCIDKLMTDIQCALEIAKASKFLENVKEINDMSKGLSEDSGISSIDCEIWELKVKILNDIKALVCKYYELLFEKDSKYIKQMLGYAETSEITKKLIDSMIEYYKSCIDVDLKGVLGYKTDSEVAKELTESTIEYYKNSIKNCAKDCM